MLGQITRYFSAEQSFYAIEDQRRKSRDLQATWLTLELFLY